MESNAERRRTTPRHTDLPCQELDVALAFYDCAPPATVADGAQSSGHDQVLVRAHFASCQGAAAGSRAFYLMLSCLRLAAAAVRSETHVPRPLAAPRRVTGWRD